jgi:hypothetical protein
MSISISISFSISISVFIISIFVVFILCETRTGGIYNGKDRNSKITTLNVVFQAVEINDAFSRRKLQYLL